jgi:hypothetical protein
MRKYVSWRVMRREKGDFIDKWDAWQQHIRSHVRHPMQRQIIQLESPWSCREWAGGWLGYIGVPERVYVGIQKGEPLGPFRVHNASSANS